MRAQIVSFHCVLRNLTGALISASFNQDVITDVEGRGGLLAGLVEGLRDLRKGEKRRVFVPADKAYGYYDPKLVMEVPRPASRVKIGQRFAALAPDGQHREFVVTAFSGSSMTLDANHPLAGQDLIFDIEAIEVREATEAEISASRLGKAEPLFH